MLSLHSLFLMRKLHLVGPYLLILSHTAMVIGSGFEYILVPELQVQISMPCNSIAERLESVFTMNAPLLSSRSRSANDVVQAVF